MCIRAVHQQLKETWTAKEMWENVKWKYTADGWYSKRQILNRLQEASYASGKNMSDFGLTMKTLLEELNDASITIQDHVTVKIIKSLGPKFETYVTVLNEKARNENKLPDLDLLLKSLEEEELRMTGKTSLSNVQTSSSGGSSQGGSGGQGRGGRGGRGGNSSTPEYKDITCHRCQKTGPIASHCTKPDPIPKDNDKSGKALGAVQLGAYTLPSRELEEPGFARLWYHKSCSQLPRCLYQHSSCKRRSLYGYRRTNYLSRWRRYCQEVHPFGCYVHQCPLHSYPGQQLLQCEPFMPSWLGYQHETPRGNNLFS